MWKRGDEMLRDAGPGWGWRLACPSTSPFSRAGDLRKFKKSFLRSRVVKSDFSK